MRLTEGKPESNYPFGPFHPGESENEPGENRAEPL